MYTNIKSVREQSGMEQKELATILGVAIPTLGNYEAGRREPPLDILCAVADLFDVSLDMLIRGKEKDRPGGRSLQELINDYENLSDEVLERNIAVSQAVLAERRLHARIQSEKKETQ